MAVAKCVWVVMVRPAARGYKKTLCGHRTDGGRYCDEHKEKARLSGLA